MFKKLSVLLCCAIVVNIAHAQSKFYTKSGKIEFFSKATMEDIDAKSKTALALLDAKTGSIQFSILMKSFEFEKALMQEHFNSDYVESDKFPKGEFKGTIVNNSDVNYSKDGSYSAKISGQLTMHGVTRTLETTGLIKVDMGKLDASSSFSLLLSDYSIKIPSVVKEKVSKTIKVTVSCRLEPFQE